MANWLPYQRCSRRSETFIWYSLVIRSYIHLYGLEISIKASRLAVYWWGTMWSIQLQIVGHIKPNSKEQAVTPCVWHVRITWDALRNDSVTPGEASLDSWRASGSPSYRKSFPCGAHQGEEQSYFSHTQSWENIATAFLVWRGTDLHKWQLSVLGWCAAQLPE